MDLQSILSSEGPALLAKLQSLGLSAEQAEKFLPAASEQVSETIATSGSVASMLGGGNIEALLRKVDVGAIAEQVGIDKALARQALHAIAPMVAGSFKSGGGASGMLGGLVGKLFR